MKLLFFVLTAASQLSSCATIFNPPSYRAEVIWREPATIIIDSDTLTFDGTKQTRRQSVELLRSPEDKQVFLVRDGIVDTLVLESEWSPAYDANMMTLGIGFLIDGKTTKKWEYESLRDRGFEAGSYDKAKKMKTVYDRAKYAVKGVVNLRLSLPWVNAFSADFGAHGKRSNVGFTGLSVGADYFYADNSFVNVSAAGIMDFVAPVPVHIDYWEVFTEHMASCYGSATNNHLFARKRFSVGYGVCYGRDVWNTVNHGVRSEDAPAEPVERESVYRGSNSLGLVIPLYYYTRRSFYMGLVWRQLLVRFSSVGATSDAIMSSGSLCLGFHHTASFELGWRIRLTKNR